MQQPLDGSTSKIIRQGAVYLNQVKQKKWIFTDPCEEILEKQEFA